jgi:hypothetical protein
MGYCRKCNRKLDGLPFHCKYCGGYFCDNHRLPEDHNCQGLNDHKKNLGGRWFNTTKHIDIEDRQPVYFEPVKYRPKYEPKQRKNNIIKEFYDNHGDTIWSLVKWAIFLLILFLLWNYYTHHKEQVNNYIRSSIDDIKTTFKEGVPIKKENPISKSYNVNSNGLKTIQLTLYQSYYDYFTSAKHEYTYTSGYEVNGVPVYQRDSPPAGWEKDYWKMFLSDKHDNEVISDIVNQTIDATKSDGDKAVQAIVALVQKIPYDWGDYNGSSSQLVKYPYETLYLNKGVCGDKSLLMAKLLSQLGYGVALFTYESQSHMAVGIQCPYDKSNFQSNYCFIEASDSYPIGQIPANYVGGVIIRDKVPQIIPISQGKTYSL